MKLIAVLFLLAVTVVFAEEAHKYCGDKLDDKVREICKGQTAGHFNKREASARGIVEECCHNPCTDSQIKQYCA